MVDFVEALSAEHPLRFNTGDVMARVDGGREEGTGQTLGGRHLGFHQVTLLLHGVFSGYQFVNTLDFTHNLWHL